MSVRNSYKSFCQMLNSVSNRMDDFTLSLFQGFGSSGVDFVAVDHARKNVKQDRLQNCHVLLSNGFSHLPDIQFDLITSNLPANVGKELLQIFLSDAKQYPKPNGRLYVVTISGLREFIKRNFQTTFGNYQKIKQRHTHTVAMATRDR